MKKKKPIFVPDKRTRQIEFILHFVTIQIINDNKKKKFFLKNSWFHFYTEKKKPILIGCAPHKYAPSHEHFSIYQRFICFIKYS